MKKYFILQEKIANYTYVDVYESNEQKLIYKFKVTLQEKYPEKQYRICEVLYV